MSEVDLEQLATEDEGVDNCEQMVVQREMSCLDIESFRLLESLSLDSFENALNAFDEFLENITIFEGANNFVKAANALDVASNAFAAIDANHDFVMAKEELEAYLSGCGRENVSRPLSWLVSNFGVMQRLSFFLGGISRSEIESARDLFHGLNYLKSNLDKIAPKRGQNTGRLSQKTILKYLRKHGSELDEHDAQGLSGLATYLNRLEPILERESDKGAI